MEIDKAIEIQTIHNDHNPYFTDAEREEAHQLSLEALKQIRQIRVYAKQLYLPLLPGETKEYMRA